MGKPPRQRAAEQEQSMTEEPKRESGERDGYGKYAGYGVYGSYGSDVDPMQPALWATSVFKRYVSIVRRHIWVVLTAFVIVATLGVLRASRAVPIYQASAKILVERQGPRITKFEDVVQPNVEWWGQEYYKTQEELAKSRAVMELAMEQPGIREMFRDPKDSPVSRSLWSSIRNTIPALLGVPPSAPPEKWERLRNYVSARHMNNSHFIMIQADSSDPIQAATIANAVSRAFVRYHMLRRMQINNEVFVYLQEQKQKEELALQEAEQKLQKFREETNISSLDNADKDNPVLKRLALLNDQLTEKQLQRIEIGAQCRVIRQAIAAENDALETSNEQLFSIPAMKEDETIAQLRGALVAAEQEKASLSDVYGPDHPRMQSVLSKVALLQSKLRDSLNNIVNSLETRLKILENEEEELTQQYSQQNDLALDLAKHSLAFSRLANELDRHTKLYQVLVERMSEVQLSADYTKTNVDVVEEAGVPKAPYKPDKQRMVMFALILGLVLGFGLAVFLEQMDDTVRTPEDLEIRVGVPVLGFVPEIKVRKGVDSKASYRALVSTLEPNSSAIEAYRNIRTNLFFSPVGEKSKVILITSGGPGDGKTTTASNLALVIAQTGKRVLLMDADFRRPRVHKMFSLDSSKGLSNVLQGECKLEQVVQKTVHDLEIIENLDILTAGQMPTNPTELLESTRMQHIISDMREKYDRVIIDTPPILFVSDTSILSRMSDGVLLVVKSDKRTRAHAARARMQLEKVHAQIIGGILNNVRVSRFGHYYSDYYYHGDARYRSDYYSSSYSDDMAKPQKKAQKSIEV